MADRSSPAGHEQAERLKAFIREKSPGGCRMLSRGDECLCLLCAVDKLLLAGLPPVEPPQDVTVEPKGLLNELVSIQLLEREDSKDGCALRPYAWKQAALQLAEAAKEHVTELNNSIGTAQTLLAAWQKRAYEAEAREAAPVAPEPPQKERVMEMPRRAYVNKWTDIEKAGEQEHSLSAEEERIWKRVKNEPRTKDEWMWLNEMIVAYKRRIIARHQAGTQDDSTNGLRRARARSYRPELRQAAWSRWPALDVWR